MWSDTLLLAERAHLMRLAAWGAGSMLAGTAVVALLRRQSPLLKQFGMQTSVWGLIAIAIVLLSWRDLAMRDVAGAARLERLIWLDAGLALGLAAVGGTLAVAGWRIGKRLDAVGAGIAMMAQGLALALLELHFASVLTRLGVTGVG
jgi:uncharacterized protein DUF6992